MAAKQCTEGHQSLFDALHRGLDFSREPGTFSPWPYPPLTGNLVTFAPLNSAVLHVANATPAPNMLAGIGQYGILPKVTP